MASSSLPGYAGNTERMSFHHTHWRVQGGGRAPKCVSRKRRDEIRTLEKRKNRKRGSAKDNLTSLAWTVGDSGSLRPGGPQSTVPKTAQSPRDRDVIRRISSQRGSLPSLSHVTMLLRRKQLLKMYFIDYPWPTKLSPRRNICPAVPWPAGAPHGRLALGGLEVSPSEGQQRAGASAAVSQLPQSQEASCVQHFRRCGSAPGRPSSRADVHSRAEVEAQRHALQRIQPRTLLPPHWRGSAEPMIYGSACRRTEKRKALCVPKRSFKERSGLARAPFEIRSLTRFALPERLLPSARCRFTSHPREGAGNSLPRSSCGEH